MIVEEGKYYLYRHIREDKNCPFYIGIGTIRIPNCFGISRYERANSIKRNKIWYDIVNKTIYTIEILLESNNYEFIKQKEVQFIKLYGRINNGTGILANLTDGGEGVKGRIITDEFRKKCSENSKGRIPPNKGITLSEETRNLISKSLTGRKTSKDSIKKSVQGRKDKALEKGYYLSEEHKKNIGKANSKIVEQYSLDNKLIHTFISCHEVEKILKFSFKGVSAVCLNKRKTYKGFIWKYKIENK